MTAKELLDAGKLIAAVEQLNHDVRTHPADAQLRTFLFELLCFSGDYQRAERQLDALAQLDSERAAAIGIYRQILSAERARLEVNAGGGLPIFLTEPPAFISGYLAALQRLRDAKAAEAHALLAEAIEAQPAVSGNADGRPFRDLSDADPFLAPFLEVIIDGRYAWVPFIQIKSIRIEAPARLRDLLWARATIDTISGVTNSVLLPVLYSGSSHHPDEQVRLGRATDWQSVGENLVRGRGQRMFLTDDDEKPMLQCRTLDFKIS